MDQESGAELVALVIDPETWEQLDGNYFPPRIIWWKPFYLWQVDEDEGE